MLKARRKEAEQLKFPEPREGLPEDPRPFFGLSHLEAASRVQEHLSSRCLIAVVGRTGAGKSTVVRRAANSRWARQWFLRDENGQPAHRRFWVDLEDCAPGRECGERVAHALARKTFPEALARLSAGSCLLVLDNADSAFAAAPAWSPESTSPAGSLGSAGGEMDETLAALVDCAGHGASVVITRRKVTDLSIGRPWTEIVEVSGFDREADASELFLARAPRLATDLRTGALVASCDGLPQALTLLSGAAADGDLEVVGVRVAPVIEGLKGLDFALPVTFAMLDADDRAAWGALSLLPSGLAERDVQTVLAWIDGARERLIHLYAVGVARRCEAGVRVPSSLRLPPVAAGLSADTVDALWGDYVSWGRKVVGPVPSLDRPEGGTAGAETPETPNGAGGMTTTGAAGTGAGSGRGRGGRGERGRRAPATATRPDTRSADSWLSRQGATLAALAGRPALPDGTFDLACAAILLHSSGLEADALDRTLLRLIETSLVPPPVGAPQEALAVPADPVAESGVDAPEGEGDGQGEDDGEGKEEGAVAATAGSEQADGASDQADESPVESQNVETAGPVVSPMTEAESAARAAKMAVATRIAAQLEDQRRFGTSVLMSRAVVASLRQGGDEGSLAEVLCQLGRTERFCTDYRNAGADLNEALERFESGADAVGQGRVRFELGLIDLELGLLEGAELQLQAALNDFAASARPVGEANASLELVRVHLARGRFDEAEERLDYAVGRYEKAGDSLGYANASLQLGQLELARGRVDDAERRFVNALDGYEQAADKVGFANACLQLGQVELARGRFEIAERRFGGALAGYEVVGDAIGIANVSLQLGQIDLARGRWLQAQQRLQQALTAYEQFGDRIGVANATLQLSQVALGRGAVADAAHLVRAAQKAYDEIGDVLGAANARQVGAIVCQTCEQVPEALLLFLEAARLYDSVGRTANAGVSLAGAARASTESTERRAYADDAVHHLRDAGLDEVARQLEIEFAEPEPPPPPEAEAPAESEAESEAEAEAPSSPWPRVGGDDDEPSDSALPDQAPDTERYLSGPTADPEPADTGAPGAKAREATSGQSTLEVSVEEPVAGGEAAPVEETVEAAGDALVGEEPDGESGEPYAESGEVAEEDAAAEAAGESADAQVGRTSLRRRMFGGRRKSR
ncbi:MAG: tetratricopeptide repeat protein [Acidimicrobiales bacterium]